MKYIWEHPNDITSLSSIQSSVSPHSSPSSVCASDPRNKSDRKYFSALQHSNASPLSLSPISLPPALFMPQNAGSDTLSHAYQIRHLANGKAE